MDLPGCHAGDLFEPLQELSFGTLAHVSETFSSNDWPIETAGRKIGEAKGGLTSIQTTFASTRTCYRSTPPHTEVFDFEKLLLRD